MDVSLATGTDKGLDGDLLRQNDILDGIPDAEFDFVKNNASVVYLPAGHILFQPGDVFDGAYFPLSGLISLLSYTGTDTSSEVALLGRENMLGAMGLVLQNATVPWRVLVQMDTRCLHISQQAWRTASDNAPVLAHRCLCGLEMMVLHVSQTAACNARHSLAERLARWLLMSADRIGQDVIPLTHEFMANMLGVRRAGVTVTLNDLQSNGLISATRGRVAVVDRPGLEQASCSCYGLLRQQQAQVHDRCQMRRTT